MFAIWVIAALFAIPPLPITFHVTAPDSTFAADTLYISGGQRELGSWRADGARLQPIGDRLYETTVRLAPGSQIEYKITRGRWGTEETDRTGAAIPRRHYYVSVVDTISVTVSAWRDRVPPDTTHVKPR